MKRPLTPTSVTFALFGWGVLAGAVFGCAGADRTAEGPCTSLAPCEKGTCVVGRCREATSFPAKSSGARVLLAPRDFAVLTENDLANEGAVESVALGCKDTGRSVLLFRFASTWREDADIQSAFFVLEAVEGAPLPVTAPPVEIARILSPWSSATTSWGRQPSLGMAEPAGELRVLPQIPLRLDVTPAVRAWAKRERDDHGLALLIAANDPNGVVTSTGLGRGNGPRLEVYLK